MPELILTCEHAGNEVPPQYQHLFEAEPEVLHTHRGLDIGALELARELQKELQAPLYYTCITRLLVEANRSEGYHDHFSFFSNHLHEKEKENIMDTYYHPYRQQVKKAISDQTNAGAQVIHFSVHSFTPVLKGETRTADIGLLFDPNRPTEVAFCQLLTEELHRLAPELVVKDNYPYLGTADGFTTHLRTLLSDSQYAGIELEFNQKFPETKDNWQHLQSVMAAALKETMKRLGNPG